LARGSSENPIWRLVRILAWTNSSIFVTIKSELFALKAKVFCKRIERIKRMNLIKYPRDPLHPLTKLFLVPARPGCV
jgi:hypothetical protein